MSSTPLNVDDFAAKIKAKYPDYANIDNSVLAHRIVDKYPDYADQVDLNSRAVPNNAGALTPAAPDARTSATAKIQTYEQAFHQLPWYRRILPVGGPDMPQFTPAERSTLTPNEAFWYGGNPGASEGKGLREGLATYGEESAGQMAQGAASVAKGEISKGGHQIISGAMNALTPATLPLAPVAPIATARALAGGYLGGKALGFGADVLGASPDQQALASDIGNIVGGFAAATGLPRALLETPLKSSISKGGAGKFILDLLQKGPRQMAGDAVKGWLNDNEATPETHPQTHAVIDQATATVHDIAPPGSYAAAQRPGTVAGAPNAPVSVLRAQAAHPEDPQIASALSDAISNNAQPAIAAPEAEPVAPQDMSAYYGQYSGQSNISGNQRQLAGPTSSAAPNPTVPEALKKNISPEIGPGTAHVTDPGFATGKMMGAHADYLNNLPSVGYKSGRDLNFSDVYDYHNDPLAASSDDRTMNAVGNMLEKYQTDPDFKNLADAARMYVHNYRVIGDIDKMSLGVDPAHYAVNPLDRMHEIPWDVDPDTRMFDGKSFGKGTISYDEGKQMAETLSGAIRNATERNVPLWRGVTPYKGITDLKPGDTVQFPLSSFSDRPSVGSQFGNGFVFELSGPSKHLNIKPFNSMMEGEHLTQGQFEVTGIGEKTIEHPPFHEGGKSVFEKVRYVKIRQKATF